MKIANRLFLFISTLIILTSVGLGYISVRDERSRLMAEASTQARTLSRTLATTFKYYHMEDQQQRIGELIHAVMPHGPNETNMRLNIYDRQGRLMDLSFEHGTNKIVAHGTKELDRILSEKREQLIKEGSVQYFSVVNPIISSTGDLQGAVEVLLSLEQININLAMTIRKFVVFILLTASLLAMLIYFISRWSISLPIANLKEASEKLGHGNLGLRIEKSGVREIDDLIEEFNRMAMNIERQNDKKEQLFTEKINLEKGLRHTDKLASIGQLASGLAHEIGTPLNVISGRAEHLLRKLTDEHPGAENLKNIIRQAERITRTMQQLLAFSRKPAAEFKSIDLEAVIHEAFSLCRLRHQTTHSQVALKLELSQKTMLADEDGIRQLFVNLMLNSLHVMKTGGKILVTAGLAQNVQQNTEEVLITFEDNGPGIPVADQDRMFDPFFTTKDVGEGTGLGLFMVANVVQEHQGRIKIDPECDQGARFIIHFPQHSKRTTHASNTEPISG